MSRFGKYVKAVERTLLTATTYATSNNIIDIPTLYGSGKDAKFVQISNLDDATPITVKIDDEADSVFTLYAGETQIFNSGDARIESIKFANTVSGGGSVAVRVILSI